MPSYSSVNVILGRDWMDDVVAAVKTDPGAALLLTPKVRLSQDPAFNPQPNSTRAGLVAGEADFSGYTAGGYTYTVSDPLTLGTNIRGVAGNVVPVCAVASPQVVNTIYGYWIDDGTNVVVAERFDNGTTYQFASPGDFLDLLVMIPFGLIQPAA